MTASQLPLPFEPRKLARTEDPETSKAAAGAAEELRSVHHRLILAVLRQGGDYTAEEIADRVEMRKEQVGRRLGELRDKLIIRLSGRCRPTRAGRLSQCYEVCQ